MRVFLFTLLPALVVTGFSADPPSKRSGFFGFGAPPSDQISAGLFPEPASSGPFTRAAADPRTANAEGIFRSGQPQKVEATSYVIENGRKVEKPIMASMVKTAPAPVESRSHPELTPLSAPAAAPLETSLAPESDEKKRGGLFGFGKREGRESRENPIVTPVPAAAPLLTASPIPAPAPVVSKPLSVKPVETSKPGPNAVKLDAGPDETPSFAGEKEEKSGWLPFFNRKKVDATAPMIATQIPSATPVESGTPPTVATTSAPAAAPTAEKPASSGVPSFEIRRDDSKPVDTKKEKEDKGNREGGILSPIAKIRPPKKEIDLTGAETIIQNGEIVGESGTGFAAAPELKPSSAPQAPQIVNGVKTYTSWDDVNARSSSAADKIIGNIR